LARNEFSDRPDVGKIVFATIHTRVRVRDHQSLAPRPSMSSRGAQLPVAWASAVGHLPAVTLPGMTDSRFLAVAHRAGNNLVDLRAALAAGVDLVEADVHLYRDALEVRHRKAIGPHLYWERWTELDRRRNLVVPELAEVLAAADGDHRLMLDLKGPSLAIGARVAEALRVHAPGVPMAVCTKQWGMLDAFADEPHVRRILSASDPFQLSRLRSRLRRGRVDGVSIRLRLLTAAVVAELRDATDTVLAWPVDSPTALAQAQRIGVTGVISKNMPMLTQLGAERAQQVGLAA
jgi:glycerophosphoryl diester phosphodiesterase